MPNKTLDNVEAVPYNGCVDDEMEKQMIIRRETLNSISELNSRKIDLPIIALILNLAVADVAAAIKAFKL